MVKNILWMILLLSTLNAENVFERNCVTCHQALPATLQEMFKRYLLIYSSETNVKAGIKHYLRYPSKDISAMSDLFVDTYGIKEPTHLSPKELDEAVDTYWEKFKVFGKLK
ncbi:MAG TPA: hypothetical protein ENK39_03735 [Epsilonproteobacteria bacterium]|nr:hypothetical protein [Campylobacterota bacterium]